MIADRALSVAQLVELGLPVDDAVQVRAFGRFLELLGPPGTEPRLIHAPDGVDRAELRDALAAYADGGLEASRRLLAVLGDEVPS